MARQDEIRFDNFDIFSGDTGTVDQSNCIIRGVSVITGNTNAEGHNLFVDSTTLAQLQACAKAKGKVPVTLDHGSGVKDLNGYLTSFRMDGDKLRADWHLLKSHDETPKMLERAEVMPGCFGMSTAFKGPPQGEPIGDGRMAARCEKLLSVDCVTRPAANAGLFSIPEVDNTNKTNMPKQASQQSKAADPVAEPVKEAAAAQEPTLTQVLEAITKVSERQDQFEQFLINGNQEQEQGLTLEELEQLYNSTDEELQALNISREDVNSAVEEALAGVSTEGIQVPDGANGTEAPAGAGVEVGAPGNHAGVSAELASLQKQVVELQSKEKVRVLSAKKAAEDHELAEIEQKALILAKQRDEAIKLAEKVTAENDALRLAVRTGVRPVKAGIDSGVRLFSANDGGEMHEFQVRVKQLVTDGKTEADAITFAQKENPGLHADWVRSLKPKA